MSHDLSEQLAEIHRREWARVLAATARACGGDLDLAEDATQEAFAAAMQTWPSRGLPDRPGAWLTTTARHRAIDRLRRDAALRSRLPTLARQLTDGVDAEWAPAQPLAIDDRLRLVFTCCHPALAPGARVALTLRLVAGLTTAQVASALLVSEPTMAARITRAKRKIATASIPYRVPEKEDLPDRLDAVLTVVHVIGTTGHTAPDAVRLARPDLMALALDLARVLVALLPDEPEVLGLLVLLLLTEARRPARLDAAGHLVVLADQDRSQWDRASVDQGLALLRRAGELLAASHASPGRFLLQAGIAAVHAEAPTFDATDWPALVRLYDRLLAQWPNPVVAVNRAVALGFAAGPSAGLQALDALATDRQLTGYHYLPVARAELLRAAGEPAAARAAYRRALALVGNAAERAHLQRRLSELDVAH
jgi:RNA polymerase sigma-70 factor (ECF subfamily)